MLDWKRKDVTKEQSDKMADGNTHNHSMSMICQNPDSPFIEIAHSWIKALETKQSPEHHRPNKQLHLSSLLEKLILWRY